MNDLEYARQLFLEGAYAFVLVRDGQVIATGTRDGVGELLDVLSELGQVLRGASLADKIVGKAVAMIAIEAGISHIYTPLGSRAAEQALQAYGIPFSAERIVPLIRNKRDDGPCPMEKLTLPLTDPGEAVAALRAFVTRRTMPLLP